MQVIWLLADNIGRLWAFTVAEEPFICCHPVSQFHRDVITNCPVSGFSPFSSAKYYV